MEQNFIQHEEDIITITGNARYTNGDCPYIKYVGDCLGDIENCEYWQQRNDAFINCILVFDSDKKAKVYSQSGNRCVAAHAIVRNQRLRTSVDFEMKKSNYGRT